MICKHCRREFALCELPGGFGYRPKTPLMYLSFGGGVLLLAVAIAMVAYGAGNALLGWVAGGLTIGVPLSAARLRESVDWYRKKHGGTCPHCGAGNRIRSWSA